MSPLAPGTFSRPGLLPIALVILGLLAELLHIHVHGPEHGPIDFGHSCSGAEHGHEGADDLPADHDEDGRDCPVCIQIGASLAADFDGPALVVSDLPACPRPELPSEPAPTPRPHLLPSRAPPSDLS